MKISQRKVRETKQTDEILGRALCLYLDVRIFIRAILSSNAVFGILRYLVSPPMVAVSDIDVSIRGVPVFSVLLSLGLMGITGLVDMIVPHTEYRTYVSTLDWKRQVILGFACSLGLPLGAILVQVFKRLFF